MFHFKQFSIDDSLCAMKVGTDGVLLGAWADVTSSKRLLDIGTGSGLLALMCAQRSTATICGIDIEPYAIRQALLNVASSPYSNRISIVETDLQHFAPIQKFDTIISNPPFFANSLLSPKKERTYARHTETLTFNCLIERSTHLLSDNGTLQVIIPYETYSSFTEICSAIGLHLEQHTAVITKEGKIPRRSLLRYRKIRTSEKPLPTNENTLILYNNENKRTPEYNLLTEDFYLY